MVESLLYDKEISVTLYREARTTKARYNTQIVQGYAETVLDGKKLLYANSGQTEVSNPLGGTFPVTAGIEFYEGNAYKVFMGYRKKNGKEMAVYKNIRYSGSTYPVDTIEQMKTGRSAGGVLFKTGDRIRVKEDKSVWTAFVREGFQGMASTYGVREDIIEEPAEVLEIKCTDHGPKPDMALSINLLPGQNCYGAVLKIRNLNLDSVDIRAWSRMLITAGYRTGKKAQYICPIFASYIESPNPDGITTFEGITVGTAEDVLNDQYIEIRFVQEKMDLESLIRGVAPAISSNIDIEIAIDDDIVKARPDGSNLITIEKQTVYAKNGMAVLSWLQTTVSAFVAELTRNEVDDTYTSVFVQLVDNTLEVIALNGPNKMPERVENVVNLDMVTGATFNGTALTVEAPWNPDLTPGGLFYMPPEFIYGSKLPNVLPAEDYRNEDNLYRALTMSLSFGSVESTNKMTVLAVPAQWAGQLPNNRTTEMRGDQFARILQKDIQVTDKPIYVGSTGGVDASSVNNISKAEPTNKQMYDAYGENVISLWGNWIALDIIAQPGDCMSVILERYFFTDANGPHLTPGTKGYQGKEANYFRSKEYFKQQGYPKAIEYFQNTGCNVNPVWWPLVTVGTYWRAKIDDAAGINHNWNDKAGPANPDFIEAGKALYIPVFDDWPSMIPRMKQLKDIWKYAYLEYRQLYDPPLYKIWRAMYYYLGGTDELD